MGTLNGMTVGDAFFNRLGATVTERTFCDSGASTAYIMTLGPTAGFDPEAIVHSRYIVVWACNVQSTNLHLWPFIAEAQRRGAKLVVIDPVRTRTAQAADWFIPIRPGTDAALALGLMHVIINEGHTDADYVERHTVGYPELVARVQEYTPERVAEITGIAAEDVRTLAREYATTQPAAIRVGVAIERHATGGQAMRAIASLPALVGAWRRPGGGLLQMPLWAFPLNWDVLHGSEFRQPGVRVVNQWRLGPALTGELDLDPPIKSLCVWNANPVVVATEQTKTVEGLQREDLFTVVHEQFLTDTARYADIVLPATTQLEQFEIMFSWGQLYLALNEPAIAPLGEAVPNTELFRRLAARMGFDEEWFGLSDEELALRAYDWSAPALEGIDLERLRRDGWARLNLPPTDVYAPHAEGNFPTPSGKVELRASMAEGGDMVLPVFRQGSMDHQPGTTLDPLPHWSPPADSPYPLTLLSPKPHAFLNSQYGNMRHQLRVQGDQTVVLHPDDAAERGVEDGDVVRVRNEHGEIEATAVLSDMVARGVVVSPMGHWRGGNGTGRATVNAITSPAYADMGHAPTFSDTRVEVEVR